jgi:hypothetical protein
VQYDDGEEVDLEEAQLKDAVDTYRLFKDENGGVVSDEDEAEDEPSDADDGSEGEGEGGGGGGAAEGRGTEADKMTLWPSKQARARWVEFTAAARSSSALAVALSSLRDHCVAFGAGEPEAWDQVRGGGARPD